MISDGSGIHADSIAINKTIPPYPSFEIVAMMKAESMPMIFATIFTFESEVESTILPAVLAD